MSLNHPSPSLSPTPSDLGSMIWYDWLLISIYSIVKVSWRLVGKQIHCHRFTESAAVDFKIHFFPPHPLPRPVSPLLWRLQLSELWDAFDGAMIERQTGLHWLRVNHCLSGPLFEFWLKQIKKGKHSRYWQEYVEQCHKFNQPCFTDNHLYWQWFSFFLFSVFGFLPSLYMSPWMFSSFLKQQQQWIKRGITFHSFDNVCCFFHWFFPPFLKRKFNINNGNVHQKKDNCCQKDEESFLMKSCHFNFSWFMQYLLLVTAVLFIFIFLMTAALIDSVCLHWNYHDFPFLFTRILLTALLG